MYSFKLSGSFFTITLIFSVAAAYTPELEPTPEPRDPPNQAKQETKYLYSYGYSGDTGEGARYWNCAHGSMLYMRWPDRVQNVTFERKNQSDLWFDRLIYVHHEGKYDYILKTQSTYKVRSREEISELSITLNGIIFDDDRVLTSFNPFRQIIKYPFKRHFTHVCALYERIQKVKDDDSSVFFRTKSFKVACARQVVPMEETKDMPKNLWMGGANAGDYMRQHSPIHDLMVIRIQGLFYNMTKDNYDFEFFKKQQKFYVHGPQKTTIAKKDDVMGSEFKFAMMGHIFGVNDNLRARRDTFVGYYNKSDNVLTECDEWIPREWGHFICVLNKQRLKRLASGAALYSRGLLFGIGSFTLYKGDKSIIVFTDVRPYERLITNSENGTCTTKDQFAKEDKKKKKGK